MKFRSATLPLFVSVALMAMSAAAHSQSNAIGIGAGVHPQGSAAPIVQYERLLSPRVSIGAKVLRMNYEYDDGSYHESGDGSGLEATVNYYFQGRGLKGPYLGAGLGYYKMDWSWTDPYAVRTWGDGRSKGLEASATFGWKFPIGAHGFIEPAVTIGNFFGAATDNTGTKESDLGFYAAALVKVGMSF